MNASRTTRPLTGSGLLVASLILAEVHDRRWRWLALGTGAALLAAELLTGHAQPPRRGVALLETSLEPPAVPALTVARGDDWDDLEPSGD